MDETGQRTERRLTRRCESQRFPLRDRYGASPCTGASWDTAPLTLRAPPPGTSPAGRPGIRSVCGARRRDRPAPRGRPIGVPPEGPACGLGRALRELLHKATCDSEAGSSHIAPWCC